MLSRAEKEYLEGKRKKITPNYRRNLNCKIRRKLPRTMKELTVIFERLNATELRFYSEDYFNLALPLMRTIQRFYHREHFFEEVKNTYLAIALEGVSKRYDYKSLITNKRYKQRMIDWLAKNGIEFWSPPTTEEQKRRFEKMKRMMGET